MRSSQAMNRISSGWTSINKDGLSARLQGILVLISSRHSKVKYVKATVTYVESL